MTNHLTTKIIVIITTLLIAKVGYNLYQSTNKLLSDRATTIDHILNQ